MSEELDLLTDLQALITQLCANGAETSPNFSNLLGSALQLSERLSHSFGLNLSQLDQMSIQLWNKTVILKTKENLDNSSIIKLRQIAFQMVNVINESSNNDMNLKKQLMMGLKITRSLLDLKELDNAERALNILDQVVQRLQCIVIEKGNIEKNSALMKKEKRDVESNKFHIFCLGAELNFSKKEQDLALSIFQKAQNMLVAFPEQAPHLSILCYNFGVDCFHSAIFDQAVVWLKNSYSIGKEAPNIDKQMQARTLRLLTNCYIESKEDGWLDKAFNAISLANAEYPQPAGLYTSLHLVLLAEKDNEDIAKALDVILQDPDSNLDLCLNALQILKKFHSLQAAFDKRHGMIKKFHSSPKLSLFLTTMLDLLLIDNSSNLVMAKTFADECVTAHMSGQRLDSVTKKQFHIHFWNKAAHFIQDDNFEEAIVWYTFSLSLYPSLTANEENLAKLHRNIATCYLNMSNFEAAFEFIEKSQQCEPSCPQTHFVAFKISLNAGNTERATSNLQRLVNSISSNPMKQELNMICMAAYLAMEKGKSEMAIPALEFIVKHETDEDKVFIALKCLIRLSISQLDDGKSDKKAMSSHLMTVYSKLHVMQEKGLMVIEQLNEEASWFMKISWNLAIQSEQDFVARKDFFVLCSQLLSLCVTNVTNHNKYQTCLGMACAAGLQLVRQEQDKDLKISLLEEVLQHVEEYKQADNQAQNSLWTQGPGKSSSLPDLLMMLYEFEALSKLNNPKAETVLERALTLHKPDPNIFHSIAALAMDPPSNNSILCMRALKVAIRTHLQAESPDFEKCSIDIRCLIELCMKSSETEALSYFKETIDMVDKKAKDKYPEIELIWLMTKSWNCGLQYFNCNKFSSAEQWCSLSMQLLKYIPSARSNYEEQMMSLYGELMNCLEREGKRSRVEE